MTTKIAVCGIGNRFRGDDAAGREVVRRLQTRDDPALASVRFLEQSGEAASLIDAWQGYELVHLIDALAIPQGTAGTIHRLVIDATPLPVSLFGCSTHEFGLAQAVELARAIGRLPPRLIVWGIEGAQFEHGETLSPLVAAAIPHLCQRLHRELCHAHDPPPRGVER
jgi:hydrogenase maturation protease